MNAVVEAVSTVLTDQVTKLNDQLVAIDRKVRKTNKEVDTLTAEAREKEMGWEEREARRQREVEMEKARLREVANLVAVVAEQQRLVDSALKTVGQEVENAKQAKKKRDEEMPWKECLARVK